MKSIKYTAVLTAACIIVLSGCKHKEQSAPNIALPVSAVKVLKTNLPWDMQYPGQAAGSLEAQLRAQVGGILKARLYEEGSFVEQGQQLFQIDDQPYKVALESAQGNLAQAKSVQNKAERDFERMKKLRPVNAVSQQDYDNALSSYESAQANVKVAQAAVNNAQINLGYTKVTAPISGVSYDSMQSVGSLISPQDQSGLLTTVTQVDPLYINFSMPTEHFTKLARGFVEGTITVNQNVPVPISVEVVLPDGSIYPHNGQIIFFASSESQQTGGIAVKAALPNKGNQRLLLPGQFVRVNLNGAVYKDAVIIPSSAVLATPNGNMVYVINSENIAEPRMIKANLQNGLYIIQEGLKGGETVISQGLIKVKPGQKVEPQIADFKLPAKQSDNAPKAIAIPAIPGTPVGGASDVVLTGSSTTAVIPLVSASTEVIIPGTQISSASVSGQEK